MGVLSLGQSFGRVPSRWSTESLNLSVIVHDEKRVNEEHAHETAFITMMLDGQYTETAARRWLRFDRFTTVYHPPALEHQDFVGAPGVRLLMFEFRPELLEGVAVRSFEARSVRDLSGSLGAWELLSLYREADFNRDSLQFESRAMELIARVAPLAGSGRRDLPSVQRAREYLHDHFRGPVRMKDVAASAGVHPVYLGQAFHRQYGDTVGGYVARLRVRAAAERLSRTTTPIAAIANELGFCDQSHFQRAFRKLSGFTPAQFRRAFAP